MSRTATHPEVPTAFAALRRRLRDVGLLLVGCTRGGELDARRARGEDWLSDLFCESPIFRSILRSAADEWSAQAQPAVVEAVTGLWLAPIPLISRRRRSGYSVVVILTEEFLAAEHLAAMCQASRMDRSLCQQRLAQLPPAAASEIGRLAAMARAAHDDQLRLCADRAAVESVGQQLAESYEEINLLYVIIQEMKVVERPERFVTMACQELLATLPYAWIGAQFADDPERLNQLAGRLIVAGQPAQPIEALSASAIAILAQTRGDAPLVLEPALNPMHAKHASLGKTALIHPVVSDGQVIGLLIAGDKEGSDTAASSVDMKLLGAIATHMAIFLENANLYDDLNAMFLGTLEALTASIDAKDQYTCGHSQRVALLTKQLAEAIGFDEHTAGRMRIAGLVHDVGKIGVPETVLLKPGKLTKEEFDWIRKHPEMGYRILKDIPQLRDILPGVLHHHERWDGTGYPQGLAGHAIPLVARLIALADAFDAMSSNRAYRRDLSRPAVLEEIAVCSGTQFDGELAPVFAALDFSQYDRLAAEHRDTRDRASRPPGEAA